MRRRLALVMCGLLLVPFTAGAAARHGSSLDDRIRAQQQHMHDVKQRLDHKRGELHQAAVKVRSLQSQLDDTRTAITTTRARLRLLEGQTRGVEARLAWNTRQLDAAQASLNLHRQALDRRLVDIYENGNLGYLDVLLGATSFSDFVDRWNDLRLIVKANEDTVRERRAAEQRVADLRRNLEGTATQLTAARQRQEQAQRQLGALADERSQLVAAARDQQHHVATQVADLEGLSAQEEAALEKLIVERQREEAERLERERRARAIAGGEGAGSAPIALSWPLSGPITSPFGLRANPFGGGRMDFHPGIDIAAPMGATIEAAAPGRVIYAGWYGGYGNAVIIDHGSSIATLYGHCSQIFVRVGQDVQRGQAIAAVGSTGMSTGPHLHFEVRVNGKPTDPTALLH
ncbi:MAG TPA: peptidoglycan DD-metalloendopeptidase family protein [Candidatus Dormibacteraeota bacterium]|nr:peptidoglycan DD-metalloendopeptidase family protein [Candidatus Dormibacteraeota bacterium]